MGAGSFYQVSIKVLLIAKRRKARKRGQRKEIRGRVSLYYVKKISTLTSKRLRNKMLTRNIGQELESAKGKRV